MPTEEVTRRRISMLTICASLILGTINDLPSLVTYANQLHQVAPGEVSISKRQIEAITAVGEVLGIEVPGDMSASPINSPAVLIHWRIVVLLLACLSQRDYDQLLAQYPVGPMAGAARHPDHIPEAADSHFHIDRLRDKLGRHDASMQQLMELFPWWKGAGYGWLPASPSSVTLQPTQQERK